jgi:glycogen operon protein
MGSYQVGSPVWPAGWLQWNDRFRDDVRGFLRGEAGLVAAVRQRVQGSPDLFGHTGASVNFLTAHDGLTMHDLTAVTSDRHRSWDSGPELRLQQLKNLFSLLLLSAGTPMWVMGDEFGRTQDGHDNPYDIDSPLTWVDWSTVEDWAELTEFVRALTRLRRTHPPTEFVFHGVGPSIDESHDSRSIAWCSGELYVMVNAWWMPLTFEVQVAGDWRVVLATAPSDVGPGTTVAVAPRSVVVLAR